MIKKIINSATWIIFILGFFITGTVAVAQNSIPGDTTYGIKIGFEKIVLATYKLVHKDTDYQIDLTRLRFKESQQILKLPQGKTSLSHLNLQILTTQENITNIQNPQKKSTYAKKYVNTLKEIKTQLDYEKTSIITSISTTSTAITISSTTTVTDPTLTDPPVIDQIAETQTQIDETISSLEQIPVPENPTETPTPTPKTESTLPTAIPTVNTTDTTTVEGPSPEDTIGAGPSPTNNLGSADEDNILPSPSVSPVFTPTTTPTQKPTTMFSF